MNSSRGAGNRLASFLALIFFGHAALSLGTGPRYPIHIGGAIALGLTSASSSRNH